MPNNKEVVPNLVWKSRDIFRVSNPDIEDLEIMQRILYWIVQARGIDNLIARLS